MTKDAAVRTARTVAQGIAAAFAVAALVLPEFIAWAGAHPGNDLAVKAAAVAAQAVAALAAVTWAWNKLEETYPTFRALLPAWLRKDVAEITDGELSDGEA